MEEGEEMTLEELYQSIDGNYEQACNVLRIEKLIDKHIRKFPAGGVAQALIGAGETMDPTALFESAHAMKGVCANLGLTVLSDLASEISEEFRPSKARKLTDAQVKELLSKIERQYKKTADGIALYEQSTL